MARPTEHRQKEARRVQAAASSWAASRSEIVGMTVVGSWARGRASMDSDLDLVVLVTDASPFTESGGWWSFLGDAALVRTRFWGELIERRVRLRSGFEVEFGFVDPAWAGVDPMDSGTSKVVRDGMLILYDPLGHLGRLAAASSKA